MTSGTSSFKIADAYVLVGGNLDERSVEQTIKQAQTMLDRSKLTLQVNLDKRSLNAAVAAIRGAVTELSKDLKVKLSVAVDDKSLAESALKVENAADAMGRDSKVNLRVGIDSASIAKADLELKAATRVFAQNDNIELRVNGSGLQSADKEVEQFSNHWTRLGTLIGTGLAVGAGPIGAAGLGILAAGWIALAVAAESSNKEVQKDFQSLESTAKNVAQTSFAPMAGELEDLASRATMSVQGLAPVFSRAALAISPIVHTIGDGLITAIEHGVHDSEPILQELPPLAGAIGDSFTTLEHGVSGFMRNINVDSAVAGWKNLAGAVDDIVDPLSLALNGVAPLSNAIIHTLGGAVGTLEREIGELRPVASLLGTTLSALSPVISFLAPPILALGLGTKILSGSWFDASGAASKLKGLVSDMPGKFSSLAQAIGYTTAAQKQRNIGAAQAAVVEAEEAKQLDQAVVSELADELAMTKSADSAARLSMAKRQLMASTQAATVAAEEFDEVEAASSWSFGPAGVALGVLAAGLALFTGKSQDAAPAAVDLTADMVSLANAAPGAADSVLSGNTALQGLINQAGSAGLSVSGLLAAYRKGPDALTTFKKSVDDSATALAGQASGMSQVRGGFEAGNAVYGGTALTVKQLSDAINDGREKLSNLPQPVQEIITKFNDLNSVSGQLGTSTKTLSEQQQALGSVTGASGQSIAQWKQYASDAAFASGVLGGSVQNTVLDMDRFAAASQGGVFSLEDYTKAQVSAAGNFLQAQQQMQSLNDAVSSAGEASAQAGQQVAAADHQVQQASEGVADAEHSEEEAANGVTEARDGVVTALAAQVTAQKTLTASLAAVGKAEQAVALARANAILQLQEEARGVLDQADTQAEAELKLHDAQAAVDAAGLQHTKLKLTDLANQKNINSTNEQSYQLLLALDEAQNGLNDTTAQSVAVNKQNNADQKAGVDGNADVLSAQQSLTSAQEQAQSSAAALAASQAAVTKANEAVTEAQYAELQAHKAVSEAQYAEMQAAQSLNNAKQAQATASKQQHDAEIAAGTGIDITTAAGNRNVTTLIGLYDAQIQAGKSTDQARVIVENEGTALGITKGNVDKVISSLGSLDGKNAQFGIVGVPSVNVGQLVSAAEQQGLDPHDLGFTSAQIGVAGAGQRNVQKPKATGGMISGPGTGTSDSIWASVDDGSMLRVSNKEFIVNAKATADNLGALHAINSGAKIRGMATGGPVGTGAAVLKSNLLLGEVGGMFQALRNAYNATGVAPSELPGLPKQNPPVLLSNYGFGTTISGNAAAGNGLRGSRAANESIVQSVWASMFGWTGPEWAATVPLIMQESGFNNVAQNPTSTAYGIFQFLNSTWGGYGIPKTSDPTQQSIAGGRYIKARYGDPIGALSHEHNYNWYDDGGVLPPGLSLSYNGTGSGEHKAVFTDDQWKALEAYANGAPARGSAEIHHHYSTTVIAQTSQDARMIGMQVSADTAWKSITSRKG